jgi:hypothetical protein
MRKATTRASKGGPFEIPAASVPEHEGRPYGILSRKFWHSNAAAGLSKDALLLYAYLRTYPSASVTVTGVFKIDPDADDPRTLRITPGEHEIALKELAASGLVVREGKWVWIVDAFATYANNAKHRAGAFSSLSFAPRELRQAFWQRYPHANRAGG